jgi:hypothetical protein
MRLKDGYTIPLLVSLLLAENGESVKSFDGQKNQPEWLGR